MSALRATGIEKRFGPVVALGGVDLELRSGEVTAIMGENGAGKSTLLKILTGDYQPDNGELELNGEVVKFSEPVDSRAAGLRVISQEPEIVPHVSVAENIYIGALSDAGLVFHKSALEKRAKADLIKYGFDRVITPNLLGSALSPAQRQVVEIMRALVDDPDVICFDEPTSSLGDEEVTALFALIERLRDEGKAIGYVSHRMHEIFKLADDITVLRDGKLIGTKRTTETSEDELVRMMVGRDLSALYHRESHPTGETVLELSDVSTEDVTNVSLHVKAGEIVGVAGLVGAGRSELMKAIIGDVPVLDGTMTVNGKKRRFSNPDQAISAGIGFAPEERKAEALVMERSVRDNTVLVVLSRIAKGFFVSSSKEKEITNRYVDKLKIRTPSTEQLVKNLSGGNQQKVVLARWLAHGPSILLLDEPTRGVDVGAKAEIYAIVDELASRGVAVLFVSSELPEVLGLADRIYVMAEGQIVGETDRASATEESILAMAMTETPA